MTTATFRSAHGKSPAARGAAGHHGVESVIAALGTNDFTRIRIGIRPANERMRKKAEEFVLTQDHENGGRNA